WESNPPELALTISQTVLKTAPITGQVAPPFKGVLIYNTSIMRSRFSTSFIVLAVTLPSRRPNL
ncbi:MAG: hypothetical protein M3Q26_08790, partial [Acidobacteriota bacterium]|nr:hypothetical protein [Acidobacteriota bacterium]